VDGQAVPYTAPTDDVYLLRLSDSAARDPLARASALAFQPGAYRCSTPEIDQLVDLALMVPGVVGAQLAGAGLGGCMMVLVRSQALQKLTGALENGYYRPRGLPVMVSACTPVQGSGIINPWG